jgi:hypothetical protein
MENQVQKLTRQQKIDILRNVYMFLMNFDRVPGALAKTWAETVQAVALVCDNISLYEAEEEKKDE